MENDNSNLSGYTDEISFTLPLLKVKISSIDDVSSDNWFLGHIDFMDTNNIHINPENYDGATITHGDLYGNDAAENVLISEYSNWNNFPYGINVETIYDWDNEFSLKSTCMGSSNQNDGIAGNILIKNTASQLTQSGEGPNELANIHGDQGYSASIKRKDTIEITLPDDSYISQIYYTPYQYINDIYASGGGNRNLKFELYFTNTEISDVKFLIGTQDGTKIDTKYEKYFEQYPLLYRSFVITNDSNNTTLIDIVNSKITIVSPQRYEFIDYDGFNVLSVINCVL